MTLQAVVEANHVPVAIEAQTCHFADMGPYTGEVSAEMLARLNVTYVIPGHSSEHHRTSGQGAAASSLAG